MVRCDSSVFFANTHLVILFNINFASINLIQMLKNFLFVGLGGALGSMLRYGVNLLGAYFSLTALIPTFLVNCIGSFLIGLFAASVSKDSVMLFCTVGLCGGFTTFSTFSSQSIDLLQNGKIATASVYIVLTLFVCILGSCLGLWLGTKN